ncbi:MAG: hypothetical protein GX913_06855, partial [Clostridiales bacterium]|nr:hypothetical protein [Clostridiales bacterium]
MINLEFEKTYKDDRRLEPCKVAIPIKKGLLMDTEGIVIEKEGKVFPSQSIVTSRWQDGSIRWVFIRFLADLPGNEKVKYICRFDKTNQVSGVNLASYNGDGKIVVNTGELSFMLVKGEDVLFEHFSYKNKDYTLKEFGVPNLKDGIGRNYKSIINQWEILENGPVSTVIQGKGSMISNEIQLDIETIITAYAGKPFIELSYRIVNTTKDPIHLASYQVKFPSGGEKGKVRNCVASSNYRTVYDYGYDGESVEKVIDSNYLLYEANEHIAEVFYGTLFADHTDEEAGLTATLFQAQQNYPKAFYADKEGICVKLVPDGVDKVVMQSGMARKQNMLLFFHEPDLDMNQINNRSLMYQMPDRPSLDPAVYEEAKVFHDVFVTEQIKEVERSFIYKADSHSRCYGMMNWGDSPDPGYTLQGRGNGAPVWTNNEYDFPHACALLYARTGIRRFLDYVLVAGEHWMDVDVCHYSEDPLLFAGQWEHSRNHIEGGKIVCSHEWVEGLIDYYHFTGDERAFNTAIGIGENILRLLDTPVFHQKGEINARETGWALRSLVALYKETYDGKWLKKCDWIIGHFEDWEKEYGHWLSPYTDNTLIRVPFMISIAVGSLMRYYRIDPQERLKDMIIRAVEDMIKHCYM